MAKNSVYLDYAAATPLDSEVFKAMQPYFSQNFYNPSATYNLARKVRSDLEAARGKVAHWLGSRNSEIIFTAGGSEANNLAIHGVMRQFPSSNIVISGIEHESVLAAAKNYEYCEVAVNPDGSIDLADLANKIDENTVLVSVMYANNEIGTIQPISEISKIIAQKRSERNNHQPLYFHSDACQASNYLDLHVSRLGVDMMTLNGGKIYGPKQSGALYVKSSVRLLPLVDGGGQERGLRSGTENVAADMGLSLALDIAQEQRHHEVDRLRILQTSFINQLKDRFPNAVINGSIKNRLPNNVHVTFPGVDNERLLIQLDELGIQAAAGSACSASNEESSHVLKALGLSDDEARSSVRFTLGRQTQASDIVTTVASLTKLLK